MKRQFLPNYRGGGFYDDFYPQAPRFYSDYAAAASASLPAQTHSIDLERSSPQYLSIADATQNGALDVSGTITFECWANIESLPANGSWLTLMSKWSGSYRFILYNNAGSYELRGYVSADGVDMHQARAVIATPALGIWYHLAWTWDPAAGTTPAAEMLFYVDGVAQTSVTVSDFDPATINNSTDPFEIGRSNAEGEHFDGLIADVRLWNVVRAGAAIAANRSVGIDPASPGLVGYWLKDDVLVGGKAKDHTANANHLTLTGSPVFSTNHPYLTGRDAIRAGGGPALMAAMGLAGQQAPTGLWLLESATSNADLSGGGFTLTNDGTSVTLVSDAALGGSVCQFDDLTSDRMRASASTVMQVTTGSFAFLWVGRIVTDSAFTRVMGGKHTGSAGYEFRALSGGNIQCSFQDGVGGNVQNSSSDTTYEDGNSFVACLGLDNGQALEAFVISNREARKELDKGALGSLTNASVFGIGQSGNGNAVGANVELVAFWNGTLPATALNQTHMSNLKTFLGI